MKNLKITCEWVNNNHDPNVSDPRNQFWNVIIPPKKQVKSKVSVEETSRIEKQIEQYESKIRTYFPQKLHEKIGGRFFIINNEPIEDEKTGLLYKRVMQKKLYLWNEVKFKSINTIGYSSMSFLLEFAVEKYLPEIFEYSFLCFKEIVESCLTDTFFDTIGNQRDPNLNLNWIIEPNNELVNLFNATSSVNKQESDAPQVNNFSDTTAFPVPLSTPTPGTNLSSSGSGAIQIINDFSSGLPGSSVAMMRGNEAAEKNRPAATAVAERILPDAKATARAIGGIDPLKAFALIVTIISIVVSSLVVMEYNAEKHRYLEMEKALLEHYETLISNYNEMLRTGEVPK